VPSLSALSSKLRFWVLLVLKIVICFSGFTAAFCDHDHENPRIPEVSNGMFHATRAFSERLGMEGLKFTAVTRGLLAEWSGASKTIPGVFCAVLCQKMNKPSRSTAGLANDDSAAALESSWFCQPILSFCAIIIRLFPRRLSNQITIGLFLKIMPIGLLQYASSLFTRSMWPLIFPFRSIIALYIWGDWAEKCRSQTSNRSLPYFERWGRWLSK